MSEGDFYGTEKSMTMPAATTVSIEFEGADGVKKTLKTGLKLQEGEVLDAAVLSKRHLRQFFADEFASAQKDGTMLSLHLKATMMKVSDPIIFGHAVSTFLAPVFEKHAATFAANAVNPNNGLGDMLAKIDAIPDHAVGGQIRAEIDAIFAQYPNGWAMVDSAKGITNLHVPNDVIIDASMPPLVRDGGKMWNKDNALEDTKALIPDRSYAGIYQAVVDDCKANGQFDHSTMGSVANVGLMAQKAEEYGSHDKTFVASGPGKIVATDASGKTLFTHSVEEGDLYRMCQTKDAAIKDWVKLAVTRSHASKSPAVFWLDQARAHDAQLIKKVEKYLPEFNKEAKIELRIETPADAMRTSCKQVRAGKDIISVTGNVLRDYLTDLFPILELGTSAKMLSIVPLLNGGGLFETGAGGSAPKHVEQLLRENHLRWDSLGEYLAVSVSLEHAASLSKDSKSTKNLADTLNAAVSRLLESNKSPSRKVRELDNRGSTFYLAMYWAQEMAKLDPAKFQELADSLQKNEDQIVQELIECQGSPVDIGGYFLPEETKANAVMRPSALLNSIIDKPVAGSKI